MEVKGNLLWQTGHTLRLFEQRGYINVLDPPQANKDEIRGFFNTLDPHPFKRSLIRSLSVYRFRAHCASVFYVSFIIT